MLVMTIVKGGRKEICDLRKRGAQAVVSVRFSKIEKLKTVDPFSLTNYKSVQKVLSLIFAAFAKSTEAGGVFRTNV